LPYAANYIVFVELFNLRVYVSGMRSQREIRVADCGCV